MGSDQAGAGADGRLDGFPEGFFRRQDEDDDRRFYAPPRLVTHIDDQAIAAVGRVYGDLGVGGRVLDLCSSWVSHLRERPSHLTVLGLNPVELAANPMADEAVVHDLNAEPRLPFGDGSFDAAVCTASVDYLVRPVEVFDEVARVLRPGGVFCCTFSNRCFPTKAIFGWLLTPEPERPGIVASYFRFSHGWTEPETAQVASGGPGRDPLWAVWAHRAGSPLDQAGAASQDRARGPA